MSELFDLDFWDKILFWVVTGFAGVVFPYLFKKIKGVMKKVTLLEVGVLAILHDRLYQSCSHFINQGYCSLQDRKNLEYMFTAYHGLGGNGTCEDVYNVFCELPYELPVGHKNE
jgi:hypothetical protein